MSERYTLEQLTGAISLGVFSEEMVLAIGRLRRAEALSDQERKTLETGQQLLSHLSSEGASVLSRKGPRFMDADAVVLDVFKAARLQGSPETARDMLAKIAGALERALHDSPLQVGDRDLLVTAQDLFGRIGELSLARTNDLFDQPRTEQFEWIQSPRSSPS